LAAGFAVVIFALIPVFLMVTEEEETAAAIEYRTSSNPSGQSSVITLTDGSTVWLSANSTLLYPEYFSEGRREVTLWGEAFFDVTGDPEKPFVVNSRGLQTTAIGTSFNIRAFDDEVETSVTVTSGRVSVDQIMAQAEAGTAVNKVITVLEADEQYVYNSATGKVITQSVNSILYTSWVDGKLSFEDHSFEEITRRLERWYGVKIHFSDPDLKQSRLRITFENTSLRHALHMLQVIEDFEFEIEERQVWIE
jgi:ferric-dicitrate binding protein FerR (iron transport regulator)